MQPTVLLCVLVLVGVACAASPPLIPTFFEARTNWNNCPGTILNQASCGSCWAFATTETFTDRLCITGEAPAASIISMQQILSCSGDACNGGWPSVAYNYMNKNGEATCDGTCLTGCSPYLSGGCAEGKDTGNNGCVVCNTVNSACKNGTAFKDTAIYYPKVFQGNFDWSAGLDNGVKVMEEIMNRGPIFTCFSVYNNFYSFFGSSATKYGVYDAINASSYVGGHCVKVVGWGSEYGKDYWLIANSWASSWGDKGFFRIIRGKNLCAIESGMGYLLTAAQAAAAGVEPTRTVEEVERDVSVSGGMFHQTSVADGVVVNVTRAVIAELQTQFGEKSAFSELYSAKIMKAETQVIAGIHYKLTLQTITGKVATFDVVRDLDAALSAIITLDGEVVEVLVPASRAPKF